MPTQGDNREILALIQERDRRLSQRSKYALFPEEDSEWTGPKTAVFNRGEKIYARDKYQKAMEFFKATATYREVNAMAANRVGKTVMGGYAIACWATGEYPPWWEGRRFKGPVEMWVAGQTNETTRDILQRKLFGNVTLVDGKKGVDGTGVIPGELISNHPSWKAGVTDLIDTIKVRYIDGGFSYISMKSYQQGRISFEGLEKNVCIAEGELVQMSDGTLKPIESVQVGDVVLSLDSNGKICYRNVTQVHDNGEKECLHLIPKQGATTFLTPDHNVYRGYGLHDKRRADSTDRIAQPIPGTFWPEETKDRDDAWYVWAALVVAEGTISERKITNGNIDVIEKAVSMLPPEARVRRKDFDERHNHVPDWFLYWDEFWSDVAPAISHTQSIPDWIFTSSKEKVRLFLRWLYMGDGWANGKSVGYATTSKILNQQIVVLLNRLGIRACVYIRRFAKRNWRDQYWVTIQKSNDVVLFLTEIGLEGKDVQSGLVLEEAKRRMISKKTRGINRRKETVNYDREKLNKRVEKNRLMTSEIREKGHICTKRVYDISVEGEHRYFVNTSLVSNCWLDEEPPPDIYDECLIRTMTVPGAVVLSTFTPLLGLSETALKFMPGNEE